MNEPDINDELKKALKTVKSKLEEGEKIIRERQIRAWKRNHQYWRNIQTGFWSDVAKDWRTPSQTDLDHLAPGLEIAGDEETINIYRAYGEALIAALSTGVPVTQYFPDDADNPEDLITAEAYSRAGRKIERDNDAQLKITNGLFLLWNEGLVAAYTFPHKSDEYGQFQKQTGTETVQEDQTSLHCESCGADLTNVQPIDDTGATPCATCGGNVNTIPQVTPQPVEKPTFEMFPKSRVLIEFYGPLHVKVPHWIRNLSASPYLILETEQHVTAMQEMFPDIAEKLNGTSDMTSDEKDRWGRNPSTQGDTNDQIVTVSKIWYRPWAFNILGVKNAETLAEVKALRDLFPKGCCATFVEGEFADVYEEDMDDVWTLTYSPVAQAIHADPLGAGTIPIQNKRNEVDDLIMQTLQYAIPETFVDPTVVDLNAYNKTQAAPGQLYPAKAQPGRTIGDAFYTNRTASLSKEAEAFKAQLEQDGQFVSGAAAPVYGGDTGGGSGTAREYETRKNQSLQRLSITWKILNSFWPELMKKAIKLYINNLEADDHFVQKTGGGFTNVWIRKAELTGKVGQIESDTSDQFPLAWTQKHGMMMELLNMAGSNQPLQQLIFHPDNIEELNQYVAWPDMTFPGEGDKNKQLAEIAELLKAEPVPQIDPMTGQEMVDQMGQPMPPQPSIAIEPDIDDDQLQMQVIRKWALSVEGQDAKVNNPGGYANVMAHFQQHKQHADMLAMQQQQMQQAPSSGAGPGDITPPPAG